MGEIEEFGVALDYEVSKFAGMDWTSGRFTGPGPFEWRRVELPKIGRVGWERFVLDGRRSRIRGADCFQCTAKQVDCWEGNARHEGRYCYECWITYYTGKLKKCPWQRVYLRQQENQQEKYLKAWEEAGGQSGVTMSQEVCPKRRRLEGGTASDVSFGK